MTLSRRLQQTAFIILAALGLSFGAVPVAHAFTFESAQGVSPDGSANLQDPAAQFNSGSAKGSSYNLPGGATLQFGTRKSQGYYNSEYNNDVNRLFDPFARDGR